MRRVMPVRPPGLYEQLINRQLAAELHDISPELIERCALDPQDAPRVLATYVGDALRRTLRSHGDDLERQVLLCNELLGKLRTHAAVDADDEIVSPAEQLHEVRRPQPVLRNMERPGVPLTASALLVNAHQEHRIGVELQRELDSADQVDLLCSFLKFTGLRVVASALQGFLLRGGRLRVLTTCYLGATDRRVLDDLVTMGRGGTRSRSRSATTLGARDCMRRLG
jgi:hypothetical protein